MAATCKVRHRLLTWTVCASLTLLVASAADQIAGGWKTGPAFRRELENPITVTRSQRTLRAAAGSLSHSTGVAIFLDRRIDGEQNIELAAKNESLQLLLAKLAAAAGAGQATLDSVVYLGPAETTSKLSTLAALRRQEAGQLPQAAKAKLLRVQPWKWEDLAEPQKLLAELAAQASVTVENAEVIPHDLWPAVSLPPLPWVDRLSLLVAGFGLTFEITNQGKSVRLVNLPPSAVLEKTYTPRGQPESAAAELRRLAPAAEIRVEKGELAISASQEDHDKIERLLAGQSVRSMTTVKGGGEKRFFLTVEKKPAGAVVRQVATELGKELKFDTAALEKLKQEVSFSVKNVSLDELLKATLKPLGLKYKVTQSAIEVMAE